MPKETRRDLVESRERSVRRQESRTRFISRQDEIEQKSGAKEISKRSKKRRMAIFDRQELMEKNSRDEADKRRLQGSRDRLKKKLSQ